MKIELACFLLFLLFLEFLVSKHYFMAGIMEYKKTRKKLVFLPMFIVVSIQFITVGAFVFV